mmetsp:Transcript_28981/g.92541  ORF Transcript_28981/g.92541 Transcript_28981/m.92541 type:complete len:238 (-) Transcript_28981:1131-1844(-)
MRTARRTSGTTTATSCTSPGPRSSRSTRGGGTRGTASFQKTRTRRGGASSISRRSTSTRPRRSRTALAYTTGSMGGTASTATPCSASTTATATGLATRASATARTDGSVSIARCASSPPRMSLESKRLSRSQILSWIPGSRRRFAPGSTCTTCPRSSPRCFSSTAGRRRCAPTGGTPFRTSRPSTLGTPIPSRLLSMNCSSTARTALSTPTKRTSSTCRSMWHALSTRHSITTTSSP